MDDAELSEVIAASGVSIFYKDITWDLSIDSYKIGDSGGDDFIELNNFYAHDGTGGSVYYDSGESPTTIDIFTIDDPTSPMDGTTLSAIVTPTWDQDLSYTAENVVFCNQEIGRIDLGPIHRPYSHFYFTGHGGLSFELGQTLGIDQLAYTYNDSLERFALSGIHLVDSFAENLTDDPSNPATWVSNGYFKIGDISEGNLATMDIITETSNGVSSIVFNLPMKGAMRIENLEFGPQDFGSS